MIATSQVILRKGRKEDAPFAVEFISQAIHSGKMQEYLFGLGCLERSRRYFCEFFQGKNTRFSHNYSTFAEIEEVPAGMYIGYPGQKAVEASLNLGKTMLKVYGFWGTLKFAHRARPLIFAVPLPTKHEFYVETLAVSEKYRGLGLGRKLLEEAEREAAAHAASFCALDVGLDNELAQGFYEHLGYKAKAIYRTETLKRLIGFSGLIRLVKKIVPDEIPSRGSPLRLNGL